jgi:hypothetical protein
VEFRTRNDEIDAGDVQRHVRNYFQAERKKSFLLHDPVRSHLVLSPLPFKHDLDLHV